VNHRIKQITSKLTYRKVPFLILYEIALVAYLYFSVEPYQRQVLISNAWLFGLGFLFLVPLAFFEKRKGLPLPYVEPMSKIEYSVAVGIAFFGVFEVAKVALWLVHCGLFSYQLSPFNPANWFTIEWNFQFGIVEESMKMCLTNVFGVPALWMRQAKAKNVWIFFAGTVSVVIWGYTHILTGSYAGPYAFTDFLIACLIGIVLLAVTLWKRNYLPAVLAHAIFDAGGALGYW
jgi:hypothetical protein